MAMVTQSVDTKRMLDHQAMRWSFFISGRLFRKTGVFQMIREFWSGGLIRTAVSPWLSNLHKTLMAGCRAALQAQDLPAVIAVAYPHQRGFSLAS